MQRAAAVSALLLLLSAAAAVPSGAQAPTPSPEQAYITARSAAAAKVELAKGDALDAALKQAQRSLEPRLRALIGPIVPPPGFSGAGEFRPAALCCYMEAGALDGLSFGNGQGGQVVVSTESLLRLWYDADPGKDVRVALENDSFRYVDGLGAAAAVTPVVALPSAKPAGASLAVARLATQCNGSCSLPDFMTVVVFKGGRAYLAMVKAALPAGAPAACEAVWQ